MHLSSRSRRRGRVQRGREGATKLATGRGCVDQAGTKAEISMVNDGKRRDERYDNSSLEMHRRMGELTQ